MPDRNSNPYVGPRSFETGERLYGRASEIRQLSGVLIAERIVLLHSPSGAGKSSLIQAGLIPELEQADFRVLPVIRVNQEPPGELLAGDHTADPPLPINRFAFSTMLSLEENLLPEQRAPLEQLVATSLNDYLTQRPRDTDESDCDVLIFDQFEEVLTLDAADREVKQEFFQQLGAALRNPKRWALISIREDYLGALDPYLRWVPTRLKNLFRLDYLNVPAALQAIQKPAASIGVEFSDAAAQKLVDDLRAVQVQQADGTTIQQLGLYVEPVQLQVVCYRLWENLPPDRQEIDLRDLEKVGDVNQSLAEYYAISVAEAARKTGVRQRRVREWFERDLISSGLRSQVRLSAESSGGLENTTIWKLVDAHLVRAEKRAGATWFELTHDRLIQPVLANNAAWFLSNLSLLQRQAALWHEQGRPEGMLLSGQELSEAEAWAEQNPAELSAIDQQFLSDCQHKREEEERFRREEALKLETAQKLAEAEWQRAEQQAAAARRFRRLVALVGVACLAALVLAGVAATLGRQANLQRAAANNNAATATHALGESNLRGTQAAINAEQAANNAVEAQQNADIANRNAAIARSAQLFSSSLAARDFPVRSLLLAVEGHLQAEQLGIQENPAARQALFDAIHRVSGQALLGHNGPVEAVVFSSDGSILATGGADGTLRLWDPQNLNAPPRVLTGHQGQIIFSALAASPDGRWLASGGVDATARLWDLRNPNQPPVVLSGHTASIYTLAFRPDSRWLATGSADDTTRLWDLQDPMAEPLILAGHSEPVVSLAFSPPDGHWLATGSEDDTVRLYDMQQPESDAVVLRGHTEDIEWLAFSPDGNLLATASNDHTVRLWDLGDIQAAPLVLDGYEDEVDVLAISPDGRWLATGCDDNVARLWDLQNLQAGPILLRGHEDEVDVVAFSRDGRWLATGSDDNSLRLWEMAEIEVAPQPAGIELLGLEKAVTSLAFNPDSSLLAASSRDGTARVWNLRRINSSSIVLTGPEDLILDVKMSPGGRWLAAGSYDGSARLWDMEDLDAGPLLLADGEYPFRTLAFSPDGRWLAAGRDDYTLWLWDLENFAAEARILESHDGWIYEVAFSPDGRWMASGSQDTTAQIWDMRNLDQEPMILEGHSDDVYVIAFSPDGDHFATGSKDGTARLWDLDNLPAGGQPLNSNRSQIHTMVFSPDGKWLVTAGGDNTAEGDNDVRLWDVQNPAAPPLILKGHTNLVFTAAFSPDGNWLATGAWDRAAILWDLSSLPTPPNPVILDGHRGNLYSLAFTQDNRWLVTASQDRTTRLWDLENLSIEPVVLRGHEAEVYALALSSDGAWLATGGWDATVRLWLIQPERLIHLACQVVGRNLTHEEWLRYLPGTPYEKTCPELP